MAWHFRPKANFPGPPVREGDARGVYHDVVIYREVLSRYSFRLRTQGLCGIDGVSRRGEARRSTVLPARRRCNVLRSVQHLIALRFPKPGAAGPTQPQTFRLRK